MSELIVSVYLNELYLYVWMNCIFMSEWIVSVCPNELYLYVCMNCIFMSEWMDCDCVCVNFLLFLICVLKLPCSVLNRRSNKSFVFLTMFPNPGNHFRKMQKVKIVPECTTHCVYTTQTHSSGRFELVMSRQRIM